MSRPVGCQRNTLTYDDFTRQGVQDCGNAFDADEFEPTTPEIAFLVATGITKASLARLAHECVTRVTREWDSQEWIQTNRVHDDETRADWEGLMPEVCFVHWRDAWTRTAIACMPDRIAHMARNYIERTFEDSW